MQLLYDSDSFAVMAIDVPDIGQEEAGPSSRGGFEIVDKFARKGIFLDGALAQSFKRGVQALVASGVDQESVEEAMDDYIAGYTQLAQPVVLH